MVKNYRPIGMRGDVSVGVKSDLVSPVRSQKHSENASIFAWSGYKERSKLEALQQLYADNATLEKKRSLSTNTIPDGITALDSNKDIVVKIGAGCFEDVFVHFREIGP